MQYYFFIIFWSSLASSLTLTDSDETNGGKEPNEILDIFLKSCLLDNKKFQQLSQNDVEEIQNLLDGDHQHWDHADGMDKFNHYKNLALDYNARAERVFQEDLEDAMGSPSEISEFTQDDETFEPILSRSQDAFRRPVFGRRRRRARGRRSRRSRQGRRSKRSRR